MINQNGYYLSLLKDHHWHDIAPLTPTATIRPGQTNSLAVVAIGADLTLFINDIKVNRISDTALSSGSVGVAINAGGLEPLTFDFDNFELRRRPALGGVADR
jgi:hypothetical protein